MRRIIIADDHELIHHGLILVLKNELPSAVIEEVSNTESLVGRIIAAGCQLIITDIFMPGKKGLDILHMKSFLPVNLRYLSYLQQANLFRILPDRYFSVLLQSAPTAQAYPVNCT